MDETIENQPEERHMHKQYTKLLGLYYIKKTSKQLLNIITLILLIITSIVYLSFLLFVDFTIDCKSFMISQYLSICFIIGSIRCWWIYCCDIKDTTCIITSRIILSTLVQLLSLCSSILSVVILNVKSSAISNQLAYLSLIVPYIVICITSSLLLLNISKLLIFCFQLLFKYNSDQDIDDLILTNQSDSEIFMSIFRSQGMQVLMRRIEHEEQRQNQLIIEQLERRQRRNRRRRARLLRNLRRRGMQEKQRARDSPEERVKIYSRIKRIVFDTNTYGKEEVCPICCVEMNNSDNAKIIPVCGHIFHEDCIEQWILKARNNKVQCPVCRLDIKDALEKQEKQNDVSNDLRCNLKY